MQNESNLAYLISQGFSETILNRFWKDVTKDCWDWVGNKNRGYGMMGKGGSSPDKWLAHRLSWVIHNGPIPEGLCVLHRCDNPACVNPNHLFLGTFKDNSQDMARKGRNRGAAKLSEEQVLEIRKLGSSQTQKQLSATFGVNQSAICRILSGKRWPHISA